MNNMHSPTAKLRLTLEEEAIYQQDQDWDDILTPSVAANQNYTKQISGITEMQSVSNRHLKNAKIQNERKLSDYSQNSIKPPSQGNSKLVTRQVSMREHICQQADSQNQHEITALNEYKEFPTPDYHKPSGIESGQYLLKEAHGNSPLVAMYSSPKNVTINIKNETYVSYMNPQGKKRSMGGELQQFHDSNYLTQKRGSTAPHGSRLNSMAHKMQQMQMHKQGEEHNYRDSYGLQGLFYHQDTFNSMKQQQLKPIVPHLQVNMQQSMANKFQGPVGLPPLSFNRLRTNSMKSQRRTADNFHKARNIYGIPEHMIKSLQKKRKELASKESELRSNNGRASPFANSHTAGFFNRTVGSANQSIRGIKKRGELPSTLWQKGVLNSKAQSSNNFNFTKSPDNRATNVNRSQVQNQDFNFQNMKSQVSQQNFTQNSPIKVRNMNSMRGEDRPFSGESQQRPYMLNAQAQNSIMALSPLKMSSLPKRNVLPPIVSPNKIQSKLYLEESVIDTNMRKIMEARKCEVVYLNVYNVSSFNKFSEFLGLGFYHTSVQMFNLEFSYGGHDYDTSGIVCVEAGNSAGLTLREKIPAGITYYSEEEIDEVIAQFGEFWWGSQYDPFNQNCNCFTERLISHVVHKGEYYFPAYINRFTKLGSLLSMWFKPLQAIFGDIVNYDEDEPEQPQQQIQQVQNNSVPYQPQQDNYSRYDQDVMILPIPGGQQQSEQLRQVSSPFQANIPVITSQQPSPRFLMKDHSNFEQYLPNIYQEQDFIQNQLQHIDQILYEASNCKERGDSLYIANQHHEAMDQYQHALDLVSEIDFDHTPMAKELAVIALLSLANCCQQLGMLDYTIHYCTQCIEIDKLNDRAYQKRANAFAVVGNYAEAKADLEIALKISPHDDFILKEELRLIEEKMNQVELI